MLYPLVYGSRLFSRPVLMTIGLSLGALGAAKTSFAVETKSVINHAAPARSAAKPFAGKDKDAVKNATAIESTAAKNKDQAKVEKETDFNSEMHIDPIPALGDGVDDFTDIDKRAADYAKEALVESEDARVERELREFKEADQKAAAADAKVASTNRAEARGKTKEQLAKEARDRQKLEHDARKKAGSIKGIENEELNWKGLED